ncbi:class I SAM-dependent DNA methyltransferase [Dietzia maris]
MTSSRLLDLVDKLDFRTLFIEELGWDNPDHTDIRHKVDGATYTLTNVASFKGLRIWHCPQLPPRPVQRQIDVLVGQDTLERLVIFTSENKQEWRWPRRSQLGAANAKLLAHPYVPGDPNYRTLAQRLEAIELDFDEDISLVTLLDRMRAEFDQEAETASAQAARLMGGLYTELETAGVDEHNATLLLARLLFLLFGDDAEMWRPTGLFESFLREHTAAETLHNDLSKLFKVLDTDERSRKLPSDSPLRRFRYVNGGLFGDRQSLPPLTEAFRELLLEACTFDWSIISPAIFGGMFQTVKSKEARREAGEHYTSEKNILKTIGPLFLDDYRARLDKAKNSKRELTKLHNELGTLQYLDPACGCGNFLIVAYREMRALELELLKLRRDLDLADPAQGPAQRAQLSLDVSSDLQVTLNQFHGFEINEWPARIAETAMLLVDHLANQQMAEEFGMAPDRLPIRLSAQITCTNALGINWADFMPASAGPTYTFGNPPFIGQYTKTDEQTADMRRVWGRDYDGYLDFVTGWHAQALHLYGDGRAGEFGYVTTNSITQGQPVPALFGPIQREGWRIKYAHRTFAWDSEAPGKAAVHCVIVGFTRDRGAKQRLWTYPDINAAPVEVTVEQGINAYLIDGPNVLVAKRSKPLSPELGVVTYGLKPADGGHLVPKAGTPRPEHDAIAMKYVRSFIGAKELVNGTDRWCLWMADDDFDPSDVQASRVLRDHITRCKNWREEQTPTGDAYKLKDTPHLFRPGPRPAGPYLAIPRHVSERRRYFTAQLFTQGEICADANFQVSDEGGLLFALISSSMFMAWQQTIGGRLESRIRFSNTLTWNTFPVPELSEAARSAVIAAGQKVLAARARHPERSLANAYNPLAMDPALVQAHDALDLVVDRAFGASHKLSEEKQRLELLFSAYAELLGG